MHLLASWPSESGGAQASNSIQPTGLFGDDIAQMSHIARKLIDDMDELMGAIVDEKQRLVFAREIIQVSSPSLRLNSAAQLRCLSSSLLLFAALELTK